MLGKKVEMPFDVKRCVLNIRSVEVINLGKARYF